MEELGKGDPEFVGKWRLLGRLGKGGMGRVYFAIDPSKTVNNEVALKIIKESFLEEVGSRARLEREVNSLNSISSPYVARIVDSELSDEISWIATERVNGPSLAQYVRDRGPLDLKNWYALAYGLLSALFEVHKLGIIHRDIKPSNVLVEVHAGQVIPKLIDFGIAVDNESTSLTRTGILVGTPAWLAPEQFTGEQITTAVDVFSAASTLHFAATGRNPWGIEDTTPIATVIGAITAGKLDLGSYRDKRSELLSNLLDSVPTRRYSAEEALKVVYSQMKESQIEIIELIESPKGSVPNKSRMKSKKVLVPALTVFCLIAVLIGVMTSFIRSSDPIEAKLRVEITSQYFDSTCKGSSGLKGIENTLVQIEELKTSEVFTVGRLDSGVKSGFNRCSFDFLFQQLDDTSSRFELSIAFPWDSYKENFVFKKDLSGQLQHRLRLTLE